MILSQLAPYFVFPDEFAPPVLVTIVFVEVFTSHTNATLAANVSERIYHSSPQTLHFPMNLHLLCLTIVFVEEFTSHTNPTLAANVSERFYRSSRQTLYFLIDLNLLCL